MADTYAFFPSPMTGHVNPFLGIARELIGRGDRVVFYLPEEYAGPVSVTGAELRTYRMATPDHRRLGGDALTRFALVPMWLTAEAGGVLAQIHDDVRDLAPDVIVYDMLSVWGRVLGRLLPAAVAMVVGSYVGNEHWSPVRTQQYRAMDGVLSAAGADFAADVARLNERYGLDLRPRDLFARDESLVLVVMTREFHPHGDTFDGRFVFMGASLRPDGAEPAAGPEADADPRPLVLVSFGTVVPVPPHVMRACADAFAGRDWRVVIAVGDEPAPAGLPRNVRAVRRVAQLDLLPRVAAFVTHGGTNSVVEALHFGTPLVVLPEAPEHAITGARVAELGLGRSLDPATVTAAELYDAVRDVATSPEVQAELARMRAADRAAGGTAAAATALSGLAATRRTQPIAG